MFAAAAGQVIAKVAAQVGRIGDDVKAGTAVVAELESDVTEVSLSIVEVIIDIHNLAAVGTLADCYVAYFWCRAGNRCALHFDVVPMGIFAGSIELAGEAQAQVVASCGHIHRDHSPGIAVIIHRDPVVPICIVVIHHAVAAIVVGSIQVFGKVIKAYRVV